MEGEESKKIAKKITGFSLIGLFFWVLTPNAGYLIYLTLVLAAILALAWKMSTGKSSLGRAVLLGIFLMAFDWAVENAGGFLGLWRTYQSAFPVLFVPIEIMALTLIGGIAWAMHLPAKPSRQFILTESLLFGFFGALGEWLLMKNGIMSYSGGWGSVHAFFGYFLTWLVLFAAWSKIRGPRPQITPAKKELEQATGKIPKPGRARLPGQKAGKKKTRKKARKK